MCCTPSISIVRVSRCAGRLQVDDELEFGRLQDRQVGALKAAGIDAGLSKQMTLGKISRVGYRQDSFEVPLVNNGEETTNSEPRSAL
jgi:hypothetical protein